jgi:hypothetical protein
MKQLDCRKKKRTLVPVNMPLSKDLTGRRFGKWLVLGCAGREYFAAAKPKASRVLWHCRCERGTESYITRSFLVNEYTTRCSHCARLCDIGLDPKRDLTGKRFGKWLVLEHLLKKVCRENNQTALVTMWLCRCDCGTEKVPKPASAYPVA